jgi:hypothetical protein
MLQKKNFFLSSTHSKKFLQFSPKIGLSLYHFGEIWRNLEKFGEIWRNLEKFGEISTQ